MNEMVSLDRSRELARAWRMHARGGSSAPVDARIGFTASFTVDALADFTGALLLKGGRINPAVQVSNYNQIVRTCLDPSSEFGSDEMDTIVILWRLEDLTTSRDPGQAREAAETLLQAVIQLSRDFGGTIILSVPPRPRTAIEGLTEFARSSSLVEQWFAILPKVAELARSHSNLYLIDLEELIAEMGVADAIDYRKEILYRQPYTEAFFTRAAEQIARIYFAKRFEAKKCIVVDCDNTLWGGVIGEDGVGGVQLSDDYPGRAFLEFQRQLKAFRDSGIFLALCTKNNPDDVTEMFDRHGSMLIRMSDVSVSKINWQPKSENLKEIAAELNIGLDALVFIDDNPFEIAEVRTHAPEVTCIQVPEDTADLAPLIREHAHLFDRLDITADDRKRVDMMKIEMERRDLSQKLTEEEFLKSLGLQVNLYRPADADVARVTQLINKTNQFNLTTRRYSADEVKAMLSSPDHDLFCASVSDKFGEYGLVGVAILRHGADVSEFDSLLMSCRVLGRGIETSMIAHGAELAATRGNGVVDGAFIPTRKNAMVAQLFDKHGFERVADAEDGIRYRHASVGIVVPDFLKTVFSPPAGRE